MPQKRELGVAPRERKNGSQRGRREAHSRLQWPANDVVNGHRTKKLSPRVEPCLVESKERRLLLHKH